MEPTFEIMLDLAEMPVGALGYHNPKRATLELFARLNAGELMAPS